VHIDKEKSCAALELSQKIQKFPSYKIQNPSFLSIDALRSGNNVHFCIPRNEKRCALTMPSQPPSVSSNRNKGGCQLK
jgi:hypothetical protein